MKSPYSIIFLLVLMLATGCRDNDVPMIATGIALTPSAITMDGTEPVTVMLSPTPGGTASWAVESTPSWLEATPEAGTLMNAPVALTLTPRLGSISAGTYSGEISLMSSAGSTTASVILTVAAAPQVQLSTPQLAFDEATDTLTFTLSNHGVGALRWEATTPANWMALSPNSGTLDGGEEIEVEVVTNRDQKAIGTLKEDIVIASNASHGDVLLPVSAVVPELAYIGTSREEFLLDYFVDNDELTITNNGNVSYAWAIAENTLADFSQITGTLAVGASAVISISARRTELATDTYISDIVVSNNKGEMVSIPFILKHFNEEKWLIEGAVKDAEYDRTHDVIIALVNNELRKYDPQARTSSSVRLNLTPNCVSVSQDGTRAIVGHNAVLSLVDLTNMTLLKTMSVTADAFDVVLAPNGYAYVFPEEDQHEDIRCINTVDGKETLHTGTSSIYENTRAKLHPSGNYIYGADNGISPSDFEKYDITGGTAAYLYDSPYHGDYTFGGNLWISEDGNRLFARTMNVFGSSTDRTQDMIYAGKLDVDENRLVTTLDHSLAADRVYAVLTTGDSFDNIPDSTIQVFDGTYYSLIKTIDIPPFIIPKGGGSGEIFASQGMFGFFDSRGTAYYTIVRNTGNNLSFAITTTIVE